MSQVSVCTVEPQCDFKALDELHRFGVDAILLTEEVQRRTANGRTLVRTDPLMRGYIFPNYKPAFTKHVKRTLGLVPKDEIERIGKGRSTPTPRREFEAGDRVEVLKGTFAGVPATVVDYRERLPIIEFHMAGKDFRQTIHEMCLRRINGDG